MGNRSAVLAFAVAAAAFAVSAAQTSAAIVFDDFNATEGHFGFSPSFSSGSVGESTTASTADRVTTDSPFEGAGHQQLVFAHDGTATNLRIRHLSGGPPYTSTQAGAPAANTTFTTGAGTDGYIGFYLRTTQTGYTVSLNLDDSTNTGAGMDGGALRTVTADGEWHLYEWNLDDDADWIAVAGIGGDGTIQAGQHSIDSIYFLANATGTANEADAPIFLDFVAKSDSGSIAALVPEPASLALLGFGALGLLARRRHN